MLPPTQADAAIVCAARTSTRISNIRYFQSDKCQAMDARARNARATARVAPTNMGIVGATLAVALASVILVLVAQAGALYIINFRLLCRVVGVNSWATRLTMMPCRLTKRVSGVPVMP